MTTSAQIQTARTRPKSAIFPVLASVAAVLACDLGSRAADHQSDNISERDSATLMLQASIGENETASEEKLFSAIVAMLVTKDGKLWVVDGYQGTTPQIRIFDVAGNLVRRVGNLGSGPGEYQNPNALTMLTDGRVVVRDQVLSDRLTVYAPDGSADTTWFLGERLVALGPAARLLADTSGLLWVAVGPSPRPIPYTGYLRLRNGTVIDTVRLPQLPELPSRRIRIEERLPSGGRSVRGVSAPFQPRAAWALDRRGRFAIARTDEYRVEIMAPHGAAKGSPSSIVSRRVPVVPVSADERADSRQRLIETMVAMRLPTRRVPEVPNHKPPIKGLVFSSDGQLLVSLSLPSRHVKDEWVESMAYDVFDQNGRYRGRLHLPDAFNFGYLRDDQLWGVWRDEYGVESIRRYTILWPSAPQ